MDDDYEPDFNQVMEEGHPLQDDWDAKADEIQADMETWAQESRVDAIVQILAAHDDRKHDRYSRKVEDYPDSEYGRGFFTKITSIFHVEHWSSVYQWHFKRYSMPWPQVLEYERFPRTNYQTVNAVRETVKVAGLDEATVTCDDMAKLRFRWLDCPLSNGDQFTMDWTDLAQRISKISKKKSRALRFVLVEDKDKDKSSGSALASTSEQKED